LRGRFSIVNAQPVKAEMSVAAPKSQAREPIQLDVILVCRKRAFDARRPEPSAAALARAFAKAVAKAARLGSKGLEMSRNDRRVILYSQFLAELGPVAPNWIMVEFFGVSVLRALRSSACARRWIRPRHERRFQPERSIGS
jgi:hypothetical protein